MPTWFGPYVFFLFVLFDAALLTAFLGHKTTSGIAFVCFAVAFYMLMAHFWKLSKKEDSDGEAVEGNQDSRNKRCPCGSGRKFKKCCGKGWKE